MPKKTTRGRKAEIETTQLEELILQGIETELGGVKVYETALQCVVNDELREEWERYLAQTEEHVEIVTNLARTLGFDPEKRTPGREVVSRLGESLVAAMELALESGEKDAAQLVAAECVVLAETKDHQNWELLGQVVEASSGELQDAVREAWEKVEDQEDEHLYHTMGWARELWIESLGMEAVLPPPEEQKHVKTAIGAARAKHQRADLT